MALQTGQPAPDFSLYDTEKKEVHLHDFKGRKVILLFFPFAFSSVCTKELCDVRDNMGRYNSIGAGVLGISVDSLYTLGKFKEEQGLNFTLLSDFNKEVSRAYGALHETFSYSMKGVSKRSAFVIDEEGLVQYAEVLENPGQIPDFEAVRKTLDRIG